MPQRDHLAVNFLQSVIIADLGRREVEYVKNFREIFLVCLEKRPLTVKSVSYTHLTLPTIYSV